MTLTEGIVYPQSVGQRTVVTAAEEGSVRGCSECCLQFGFHIFGIFTFVGIDVLYLLQAYKQLIVIGYQLSGVAPDQQQQCRYIYVYVFISSHFPLPFSLLRCRAVLVASRVYPT